MRKYNKVMKITILKKCVTFRDTHLRVKVRRVTNSWHSSTGKGRACHDFMSKLQYMPMWWLARLGVMSGSGIIKNIASFIVYCEWILFLFYHSVHWILVWQRNWNKERKIYDVLSCPRSKKYCVTVRVRAGKWSSLEPHSLSIALYWTGS